MEDPVDAQSLAQNASGSSLVPPTTRGLPADAAPPFYSDRGRTSSGGDGSSLSAPSGSLLTHLVEQPAQEHVLEEAALDYLDDPGPTEEEKMYSNDVQEEQEQQDGSGTDL